MSEQIDSVEVEYFPGTVVVTYWEESHVRWPKEDPYDIFRWKVRNGKLIIKSDKPQQGRSMNIVAGKMSGNIISAGDVVLGSSSNHPNREVAGNNGAYLVLNVPRPDIREVQLRFIRCAEVSFP